MKQPSSQSGDEDPSKKMVVENAIERDSRRFRRFVAFYVALLAVPGIAAVFIWISGATEKNALHQIRGEVETYKKVEETRKENSDKLIERFEALERAPGEMDPNSAAKPPNELEEEKFGWLLAAFGKPISAGQSPSTSKIIGWNVKLSTGELPKTREELAKGRSVVPLAPMNIRERVPTDDEANQGKANYAPIVGFARSGREIIISDIHAVFAKGSEQIWAQVPRYSVVVSLPNGEVLIKKLQVAGFRASAHPQKEKATAEHSQAIWLGANVPWNYAVEVMTMALQSHPELRFLDFYSDVNEIFLGGDPDAARAEGLEPLPGDFIEQLRKVRSRRDLHALINKLSPKTAASPQ